MSYEKYCAVIDQLCQIIGLQYPRQFYEIANITVEGASLSLIHGGKVEPDSIVVFCDFGIPPAEKRDEAISSLLLANIQMALQPGRGSFSINAFSDHILYSSVLPLRDATGAWLMQVLEHYARQLKAWKEAVAGEEKDKLSVPSMSTAAMAQGRGQQAALMKKLSLWK